MTIEQAQKGVDEWIKEHGVRYFDELTNLAMLTEEVGRWHELLHDGMGSNQKKKATKRKTWEKKWLTFYLC